MEKNLPDPVQNEIEEYLVSKQRQIEEQLVSLESNDPVLNEMAAESPELGTESWRADVHAKSVAVKGRLLRLLTGIKISLLKLREGTYGRCEHCGKQIEFERLKAMPVAAMCSVCVNFIVNPSI